MQDGTSSFSFGDIMLNKLLFKNSFRQLSIALILTLLYFSCVDNIVPDFTLSSSSFTNNGALADKYAATGAVFDELNSRFSFANQGISPQLSWANPPSGTRYYTLTMVDTTARARNGMHWAIYNIPVGTSSFAEGFGNRTLTVGTNYRGNWDSNYVGPWPPPGEKHNYVFTLYALGSTIAPVATTDSTPFEDITEAVQGKTLGTARLTGTYTGK